jgi:hypothetical protein
MSRVSEILDRLVEAVFPHILEFPAHALEKLYSRKIAIFQPLDGYYSFNLSHMQPAFYLLLIGWCLSVFCIMVELLYNRLLSKRN